MKIVKVGHHRVAQVNVGGVQAACYRFDKMRVYVERDGSTGEVPFSQLLYLLKLPGEDRKLWLTPVERQRVLEALQEAEPMNESKTEAGTCQLVDGDAL